MEEDNMDEETREVYQAIKGKIEEVKGKRAELNSDKEFV